MAVTQFAGIQTHGIVNPSAPLKKKKELICGEDYIDKKWLSYALKFQLSFLDMKRDDPDFKLMVPCIVIHC